MPSPITSETASPDLIPVALEVSATRGRYAWRRLGLRLYSITPTAILRTLVTVAFFGAILWLVARAGTALLPFWVGLVLAYVTLPFVNWLDRFMPRIVAVLLLLAIEVLILVAIVAVMAPIFVKEAVLLVNSLPSWSRIYLWLLDLETYLKTLPMPVQNFLDGWLRNAYDKARYNFTETLTLGVSASALTAFNAARATTFLLGFLVIPTWLVSVLNDQRQVRRALDHALPPALRPDFWAIVRIFDRTFNVFVRGRLVIATLIGVLMFFGLRLFPRIAAEALPFPLAMALIAGMFNLVPIVGAIVGAVPLALMALSVSWQLALAVVVLYVLVVWAVGLFVTPWLESMAVDIHPAALAPIVILGSTFGFLGAVLAGPIAVVARDLFRYTHGRLEDPPQPAGLLPGDVPPVESPPPRVRGRVRRLVTERE